jgi:DNA polymerase-3 subunit gamma/tau
VVFILATTEEEKLLDTILSRCQVFRFRSPSRAVLASLVTDVAKKEGFTLVPEAADLVALAADGSFRDALGVTQKVILASGDAIGSADEVAAIIGAPKTTTLLALLSALDEKNTEMALGAIAEAVSVHADMKLFSRLLLEHVRAVMLIRHQKSKAEELLASFGNEAKTKLTTLSGNATSPINSQMLLRLLVATQQIGFSPIPHLPLEIAVVELTEKK